MPIKFDNITSSSSVSIFIGREAVNLHLEAHLNVLQKTLKCVLAAFVTLRLFSRHHNIDILVSIPTYFSKTASNYRLRFLSKLLSKIEQVVLLYLEDPSENNTK